MIRVWLIVLAVLLAPSMAKAATACTGIAATALAFGTYASAALMNSTSTVTLSGCGNGFAYSVGLNAGLTGTITARKLTGGGHYIYYGLAQNAARTTNWGTTGSGPETGTTSSSTAALTVYGLIPAGQYPTPGTYTDTITATGLNSNNIATTFVVSVTVAPSCTLSATNLAFGSYTGVQLDATSTVTVNCTNSTPWYINLNNGLQYSCCYSNNMKSAAGASVNYELYQNAARTTPWQNTVNLDGEAGTGSSLPQPLTVYGRVFGNQYVAPGAYVDTVVATVTF